MGSLRNAVMKEKDEELALFFEMYRLEKEQDDLLLLENSDEFDAPLGSATGSSPIYSIASTTPVMKIGTDDFLNSENYKNDYEWLISPPDSPLFSSLELDPEETITSQLETPEACAPVQKCRLSNPHPEPIARSNLTSREPASSPQFNTSRTLSRRHSYSGGSKPSIPGVIPTLSKSRSTLTSLSKPTSNASSKGMSTGVASKTSTTVSRTSRSATPTSCATLHSTKPTAPPTPSTPNSRSIIRSSTPATRPSIPGPKSTSRAAAPSSHPTLSTASNTIPSPGRFPLIKSTNGTRNPPPLRASSPTMKQRSMKPSDSLRLSLDASPNSMKPLSDKPVSAPRGRPGASSVDLSSVVNGRIRRLSCSPARGRPPNFGIHSSGSSVPVSAMSRLQAKANTNVSPVMVGTKMVERVINMRKLAPPKQDNRHSPNSYLSLKSSSPDSSGFGRTLSKKSLDMAMRHMDIRRSVPGNTQTPMTKNPASSTNSVRSGPRRKAGSVSSDTRIATISRTSSEVSVDKNSLHIDGCQVEDDIISKRDAQSPASVDGR
nr:mucin-5AC isoform X2 [Ipomoea batatas]GMD14875.1 mucin-5AC isoform X2 [Ipomoea batatas]